MSQSTSDVFDDVQINSETISSTQFEDMTVVEEYDVNKYSYVTILKSDLNNEYLYRVCEPELTDFEELIRSEVASKLVDALKYHDFLQIDQDLLPNVIRQKAYNILSTYVVTNNRIVDSVRSLFGRDSVTMLDETEIENILYYIVRDFSHYGKLTPLMEDPNIEDISCNASNIPIFIYHSEYQDLMTNVVYDGNELDQFVRH
jgi:Type IV secretory pathway, VirB11 components, and related ATPases involved in archaeal flagella biosynthesis